MTQNEETFNLDDWIILRSRTGYTKDGFPYGTFICRNQDAVDEVKQHIDENDLIIENYSVHCIRHNLEDIKITGFIENGREYPLSLPVQDNDGVT